VLCDVPDLAVEAFACVVHVDGRIESVPPPGPSASRPPSR
jgi:hypothetical protein